MKTPAVRRSPPRRRVWLVAVVLAGLAAGACGTQGAPRTSSVPPPVATAASKPEPSETVLARPLAACHATDLAVRVVSWEGAAGSRIGSIELVNSGAGPCTMFALAHPMLLDGAGSTLIEGAQPPVSEVHVIAPGQTLSTLVQASNYCGPEPVAPVTVAFVLPGGLGRVVAAPPSTADTYGLPPCTGAAGTPGNIEMQPWAP